MRKINKQNSFFKAGFIQSCCDSSGVTSYWKLLVHLKTCCGLLYVNAESIVYYVPWRTLPHHLLIPVKKLPTLVVKMAMLTLMMKELQQLKLCNSVSGGTGRLGTIMFFQIKLHWCMPFHCHWTIFLLMIGIFLRTLDGFRFLWLRGILIVRG